MEHSRYIRTETTISAVLNAVIGAAFVFLMFGGMQTIGLWGANGLAIDLLPTVFMITLMTTVGLTLITRARVRAGKVPKRSGRSSLSNNVFARALVLAAGSTIAFVPASVLGLALIWAVSGDWLFIAVLVFKVMYSALLGVIVTPIILRAALAD